MTTTTLSSISDSPVTRRADDLLGHHRYAEGLARFIENADMPITIGIQGGWGSGKTSLLNFLTAEVEADSVVVNVNAWEFSLFQHRGAVAIGLLNGLVETLSEQLKVAHAQNRIQKETYESALNLPGIVEKIVRKAAPILGGVAGNLVTMATMGGLGHLTNVHVGAHLGPHETSHSEEHAGAHNSLRELRDALRKAVETTCNDPKGKVKRILFVIDDLDRVEPSVAVEILDVLKNVVEVPRCVFLLAIDFDVVVKGLRAKFGERADDNEREFRQYFDKIIQVPFSMPVGGDGVASLIGKSFAHIGRNLQSTEIVRLSRLVNQLTDATPRSVKRIINATSLLLQFRPQVGATAVQQEDLSSKRFVPLFALVCIQIHFPRLFERLASGIAYWDWQAETVGTPDTGTSPVDRPPISDWQEEVRSFCRRQDRWTQAHTDDLVSALVEIKADIEQLSVSVSPNEVLQDLLLQTRVTSVGISESSPESNSPWPGFWRSFLEAYQSQRPQSTLFRRATGSTSQWISSTFGVGNLVIEAYATTNEVRARLCFSLPDQLIFDTMLTRKAELESSASRFWQWDWKAGRKTNYISSCLDGIDVRNKTGGVRTRAIEFLIQEIAVFEDVVKGRIATMDAGGAAS